MPSREYMRRSIQQLEVILENNSNNLPILLDLRNELRARKTNRSALLLLKVNRWINWLEKPQAKTQPAKSVNAGESGQPRSPQSAPLKLVDSKVARPLEAIRTRLLDLSRNNRLLNYRHPRARSIRVIDELPDQLFDRLIRGKGFVFDSLPRVPKPGEPAKQEVRQYLNELPIRAKPDSRKWAELHGINPNFELPVGEEADGSCRHQDLKIQTLLLPAELETRLKSISRLARTAIEESGANILYLAFGFLEWREDENSEQLSLAPLVLLPVRLERSSREKKTRRQLFKLSYSEEDLQANLSLRERLRDLQFELPEIEDDDTPESYIRRCRPLLRAEPTWRIHRYVTLGFFQFGKLLMYLDLDPARWPEQNGILDHGIISRVLSGEQSEDSDGAATYPIDDIPLDSPEALLIESADSSQHSALIDAAKGKNLVIEGPPGTGKSQTITNIIGVALAQKKSILFISEKLAALEVVRKRLEDSTLGEFCLELHSHKTQKGKFLEEVAERLELKRSAPNRAKVEREIQHYETVRDNIAKYLAVVAQQVPGLDMTYQDLFCRVAWLRKKLTNVDQIDGDSRNLQQDPSAELLNNAHARVSSVVRTRKAIAERYDGLRNHPMYGLMPRHNGNKANSRQKLISIWKSAVDALAVLAHRLSIQSPGEYGSISDLERIVALAEHLKPEVCTEFQISYSLKSDNQLEKINQLFEIEQKLYLLKEAAGNYWQLKGTTSTAVWNDVSDLQNLLCIGPVDLRERTAIELAAIKSHVEGIHSQIDLVASGVANIGQILGFDLPDDSTAFAIAKGALELVGMRPKNSLGCRSLTLEAVTNIEILERLIDERKELLARRARLRLQYVLSETTDVPQLSAIKQILENATRLSIFEAEWRAANKQYQNLRYKKTWVRRSVKKAADVGELIRYQEDLLAFERNADFATVLGGEFRGLDTPAEQIYAVCNWFEAIRSILGTRPDISGDAGRSLMRLDERQLEELDKLARSPLSNGIQYIGEAIQQLGQVENELAERLFSEGWSGISAVCDTLATSVSHSATVLFNYVRKEESKIGRILAVLERLVQQESNRTRIDLHQALVKGDAGGPAWNAIKLQNLEGLGKAAEALLEEAPNSDFRLVASGLESDSGSLREAISQVDIGLSQCAEARSSVSDAYLINESDLFGRKYKEAGLNRIAARLALTEKPAKEVREWYELADEVTYLAEIDSAFDSLRPAVYSDEYSEELLNNAVDEIVLSPLASNLVKQDLILKEFDSASHEQLISQFIDADNSLTELSRQKIAAIALECRPPGGQTGQRVGDLTEMHLIRHELGKKSRHLPIRKMVQRAGRALQALKPCFMMGPLSVAQYLPPGQLNFDLVVMDEASQMRPQDALGAIARGGQLIVVGDPKQLPPTSFFDKLAGSDDGLDEDEEATFGPQESILDLATPMFSPSRTLQWHYRSRHHSLIAFSNEAFYNKRLLLFPTAHARADHLGVQYNRVNGVYSGRANQDEASEIVRAAIEEIRSGRGRSVGIAAVNSTQTQAIADEWDRATQELPELQPLLRSEDDLEQLFIKNLENVQGDERDVIFISLTYGRDEKGNFYGRFGPINREDGWRRLNVLFTRAREQMVVFSSMDSSMIALTESSHRGPNALKDFLKYCETGIIPEAASESGRPPDSPFEEDVAAAVREYGLSAEYQVGVAGFFIDIGVVDPREHGHYLMGIECDGATYHSARSVRDRDKIRQEILENLGWNIYRIWSPDWFKNPDRERRRLRDALLAAKAQADARFEERESVEPAPAEAELLTPEETHIEVLHVDKVVHAAQGQDVDELRDRLLDLRYTLEEEFPEVDASHSILRNEMLDYLLEQRPITPQEFHQRIPIDVRRTIDSEQARLYLSTILMVIEDYA